MIDAKTGTLDHFVLLHQQRIVRDCEVSVRTTSNDYEVVVLGESDSLRLLPRLGFELQDKGLLGINLDRYGRRAESPEGVMAVCTWMFETLPSTRREVAPRPAIIDCPLVRLCELVKDRFSDLDVSCSGPIGRVDVWLADGGLRVERETSDQTMALHVWINPWQGLLVPGFEGFGGLRRYFDKMVADLEGIITIPAEDQKRFLMSQQRS